MAQAKGEIDFQDNRPGTRVVLTAPLPTATEDRPDPDDGASTTA
jgi:hypothetical protein